MKILKCNKCGNVLIKMNDHCDGVFCCGEKMQLLVPGAIEGAVEKHKPVFKEIDGQKYIVVGDVEHPMTEQHYIEFVVVDFGKTWKVVNFEPGDKPMFPVCCDCEPVDVYAYCNLHGLWKMDK